MNEDCYQSTQWTYESICNLYSQPFFELILQAHGAHKEYFDIHEMECCTLLSIKTGACPEDCAYCPQSGIYSTNIKKEKLLNIQIVIEKAEQAKKIGATRFCIGAAWREPPDKDFPQVLEIIKAVKSLGLETCASLGMLSENQCSQLKSAGLDFYNHNLDSSKSFYQTIITTRQYQDRLNTLARVAKSGIAMCCGGILGMGETLQDRIELLLQLLQFNPSPKSIPINQFIPIEGTPLQNQPPLDPFDFIKIIAVTRILFPKSKIRLSAGRHTMSEEMQAWCFMAGANSIFLGEKLLTAPNSDLEKDYKLFKKLGLRMQTVKQYAE